MPVRDFFLRAALLATALAAAPLLAQRDPLPYAPVPVKAQATQDEGWRGYVNVGEPVAPLTVREKMTFPLHEELTFTGWFSTFFTTGWEQLRDSDPRYGVDSGAFGQRLGAAALRDLTMRGFSDGLLPLALHEDPRYYRQAQGPAIHRGLWAVSRVFVNQRDSGASGFNYSTVVGHGMASALTMTYYPEKSTTPRVVFTTWSLSLLGQAVGNLWSEFWPDASGRIFHRNDQR